MSKQQIVSALKNIVGDKRLITDAADCAVYGRDRTNFYTPKPTAVTLPGSNSEIQAIVRLANDMEFTLTPSGGRTGLSGGAVAANGEVVVALDRMNRILEFNPTDRTVLCQAGVITRQLQQFAEDKNFYYPVDFASSGSSQLGGNISTNAGGIKVIHYGMTRNWVVGLKVVTGAGELLDLNRGLMKNNTGYDLNHLFIGAEGTLGFIVEATVRLTRIPKNLTVMVLAVADFVDIMSVLQSFRQQLDLTAFEFFPETVLQKVLQQQNLRRPFDTVGEYYALIEFEASRVDVLELALATFQSCIADGWVLDGTMSQNQQQAKNLWRLREDISETLAPGTPYKNDLSVRVSNVPSFVEALNQIVQQQYPDWEVYCYGHIGDGNVHLNILKPDNLTTAQFLATCKDVSKSIFEVVAQFKGSISAEHGVGLLKKDALGYTRSAAEIALMQQIKKVFDPKGIMNPGKIFDPVS